MTVESAVTTIALSMSASPGSADMLFSFSRVYTFANLSQFDATASRLVTIVLQYSSIVAIRNGRNRLLISTVVGLLFYDADSTALNTGSNVVTGPSGHPNVYASISHLTIPKGTVKTLTLKG